MSKGMRAMGRAHPSREPHQVSSARTIVRRNWHSSPRLRGGGMRTSASHTSCDLTSGQRLAGEESFSHLCKLTGEESDGAGRSLCCPVDVSDSLWDLTDYCCSQRSVITRAPTSRSRCPRHGPSSGGTGIPPPLSRGGMRDQHASDIPTTGRDGGPRSSGTSALPRTGAGPRADRLLGMLARDLGPRSSRHRDGGHDDRFRHLTWARCGRRGRSRWRRPPPCRGAS